MLPSFGSVRLDYLFAANELPGIGSQAGRWQAITAFMKTSEGVAERLIEKDRGILLLVTVPGQPDSGVVYVYNDQNRAFYMIEWSNRDYMNANEFDTAFLAYHLENYISTPPNVRHRSERRDWRRNHRRVRQARTTQNNATPGPLPVLLESPTSISAPASQGY
jgi:hypothetical protein